VKKVGQLSQNVRLDFSRPEDKFVLMIENLAWDPDEAANAMLSAVTTTNSTGQLNTVYRPCLQFYNDVLENLGPLMKIKASGFFGGPTEAYPFSPFSTNILDRTSRGLLSSGADDKAICQDKRTYNGSYLCLSGQKIVAMDRF
jgi:hypothetical protein